MSLLSANISKAGNLTATTHLADYQPVVSGSDMSIQGTSSISGVAINSNGDIVLTSGASYYLECSGAALSTSNNGGNAGGTVRWYNQTTTSYVGQQSIWRNRPADGTRVNRMVVRCLILASDFGSNSTMTISLRNIVGSVYGSVKYGYNGAVTPPHVRIVRIA